MDNSTVQRLDLEARMKAIEQNRRKARAANKLALFNNLGAIYNMMWCQWAALHGE